MKTCGEVLVELLEAYGIETVFGIPGVHTVELYRGLPNTKIRHITPRHEQGAGFMADGYARACGKVAACFIITGPGMTNIATAMGQALADSIPMLVISSVNNSWELGMGEGRLHELLDQCALVGGVARFSHRVLRADELPAVLARAFAVFDSARPGPVHIELPLDVITAPADHLGVAAHRSATRPAPDPAAIARAAVLLADARAPFVVLGGGAARYPGAARTLADRLGAPVGLTINAKGLLPSDHPLSLGATLPEPAVLAALRSADVVLAVGTELGETDTLTFYDALKLRGKVIRIDIDPEQLARNAVPTVGICADAGAAMAALAAAIPAPHDGAARAAALREAARGTIRADYKVHGRFLDAIAAALPGVVIAGDQTQPVYGGNVAYNPDGPGRWFNASTGYGTLGYGMPAAFGAKLGLPDTPVVALIGDGGFQFTLSELATASEIGLPVPVILWNNRGYGEIKAYMENRSIPTIGVDIYTPDFLAIAAGFGCATARPGSYAELTAALQTAVGAGRPTVIEIDDATVGAWS